MGAVGAQGPPDAIPQAEGARVRMFSGEHPSSPRSNWTAVPLPLSHAFGASDLLRRTPRSSGTAPRGGGDHPVLTVTVIV